jgi:L-galactose dehydrogenase/L-glyceraldehyde 3-phosphate reductase
MELRDLGRSGLKVSVLGFGCGAVGGLMTRGDPAEQERAVARALELGVTYFDTAADYGTGESEKNIGRILRKLNSHALLGTKIRVPDAERGAIGACITKGLEDSLRRLGRDSVDLFQLHNPVTIAGAAPTLSPAQVLEEVVPALQSLQRAGKTRCVGITGIGDAAALRKVVESGAIHSAQVPFNLLNPSADASLPAGSSNHDFGQIMRHAKNAGVGVIGIRVLAAGALSGSLERHPNAAQDVAPIASGATLAADVAAANRLRPLVSEGHAGSLVEAALRYVIASDALSTVLIGIATLDQFETAAQAVLKGPLSPAALARAAELQRS